MSTDRAQMFSCPYCNGYGGYASLECGACESSGSITREAMERCAAIGSGNASLSARVALKLAEGRRE